MTFNGATSQIRTGDPRITSAMLWPAELKWQLFSCFGDPYGNRTHVSAVKGRCLNRLTMEPHIYLSLCFSHDRNLIYHKLGCLASVFLNFPKNFYFSDFFLFSADSKSFACFFLSASCPVHNRNNESICPLQKCMI